MKVWVYSGQHDLQIEVAVFSENAEVKAREYATEQKRRFKERLVYSLDLMDVIE